MPSIPLSVLDLVSLQHGTSVAATIEESVQLAQAAERLGYKRVWYAEHHNSRGLATAAPEVMIQHVASRTAAIRVGSGGVMLPNHAPLKIAEVFRLLNVLFPGRIDLGLGRAPGTDQRTALAIRRNPDALTAGDYPELLVELLAFGADEVEGIVAIPVDVPLPPVHLLGSSGFSAQLAAQAGLPFSFASHINRGATEPAMNAYRERFQPSRWLDSPEAMLTCSVIIGDTEEHARQLLKVAEIATWQLISGTQQPLPTLEEALANPISELQRLQISQFMSNAFVGDAASVAQQIHDFAMESRADEVMVTIRVPGLDLRVRGLTNLKAEWTRIERN